MAVVAGSMASAQASDSSVARRAAATPGAGLPRLLGRLAAFRAPGISKGKNALKGGNAYKYDKDETIDVASTEQAAEHISNFSARVCDSQFTGQVLAPSTQTVDEAAAAFRTSAIVKVKNTFIDGVVDSDDEGDDAECVPMGKAKSAPSSLENTHTASGEDETEQRQVMRPQTLPARLPSQMVAVSSMGHAGDAEFEIPTSDALMVDANPARESIRLAGSTGSGFYQVMLMIPMPVQAAPGAAPVNITPSRHRQPENSCGSQLHAMRQCKPCAWFWKREGCANGVACQHCHMCPQSELKARKKLKASMQNWRLR